MDGDLERAEPSPSAQHTDDDGRREEQVRVMTRNDSKNATTVSGDSSALVAVWMQRLQMLTLITTFLASIDGDLFVLTSTSSQTTLDAQEFIYACFTGALVFHICAAILGYVASFALIQYQIGDVAPSDTKNTEVGEFSNPGLYQPEIMHGTQRMLITIPPFDGLLQTPLNSGIQVRSRTSIPPLDLLTRCYFTTLALGSVGFILVLLGIAGYAWVILRQVVGIFTVVCLGVSIVASVWAVL
ncbi:uncharacterized protein F5891DRAFT_1188069 [Suillus fuscotomentosus]|uniref:Transmembrane protein n=1 Tax=Suillus fuscotomentosus TaxID=1912939 RepID=A0AAD4HLL5_9AGAM|nr:uncharacterized protein F5891DRAFT_1188069 [Suillus fuscotomentosus]KAG1900972.1 hypothetical protein F5891DRAFT_1188069 [Suillus fuscotomentosus]